MITKTNREHQRHEAAYRYYSPQTPQEMACQSIFLNIHQQILNLGVSWFLAY